MELQRIDTEAAPEAIGPYSQAVVAGGWVFTAGQIALHPQTMELVGEDIGGQTEQVLTNLNEVLQASGSEMRLVVKTTVYLADMADFAAMNAVYERHFGEHRPARSTVAVRTLPKNARVEIDCVARTG
ncbi:MAG: RidA family protein [Planctomycetota bacterium]